MAVNTIEAKKEIATFIQQQATKALGEGITPEEYLAMLQGVSTKRNMSAEGRAVVAMAFGRALRKFQSNKQSS